MAGARFAKLASLMRAWEWPLLFAIFLDLVGFGMAFPDIQLRAEDFGAPGWMIGALLSSYFAVQLLASPRWGMLSDRIGRKPVLLACTLLSAISMLVYAYAQDVWLILGSRLLAGLAAANVVVAQAYAADHTDEKSRNAAMGRLSAALLIGLVMGPAIGGELAERGGNYLMGMTAAAASGVSFLFILVGIRGDARMSDRALRKSAGLGLALLRDLPDLRRVFFVAAAGWFVLACLEGTFGRLIERQFDYGQREFGVILSYESLLGAAAGAGLARLSARFLPVALLRSGYALQGIGLAFMPLAPLIAGGLDAPASGLTSLFSALGAPITVGPGMLALMLAATVYGVGLGVTNPTLNTVCSSATPNDRQGELFGLLQATRSAGFLIGPTLGGALFDLSPASPYYVAAGVALAAAILIGVPERRQASVSEPA